MSLPIPLAVRLKTARGDRNVTADLRDLRFRSTVPGGFASASIALDRPLSIQPDEIDYYGRLHIHDTRSGQTVWEGRLEDPGRSAGDGQVWSLTAMGPSAHARDRTVPLIYVDRRVNTWIRIPLTTPTLRTDYDESDSGAAGVKLQFDVGAAVAITTHGGVNYQPIRDAGQKLARLAVTYKMGGGTPNYRLIAATWQSATAAVDVSFTGTETSTSRVVVTDWPNGDDRVELKLKRTTAAVTADDNTWMRLTGLVVLAMRYNRYGDEQTSPYATNYVLADEVIADLLGRLLTEYDGANATIAFNSNQIEQLAYPDGVMPEKVLGDLMVFEPGYYWAAWERNPATDKHRFEWTAWPSFVRYEADSTDGYDSTGSADGLYNRVRVRWRDVNGQIRTTLRTQVVPALAAAGLSREYLLDLGDEIGSAAAADKTGDEFLLDHRFAPNAGRLSVARRILDRWTGRMVDPWEIRPGHLIRVRGILPRVDALNASARDGTTVFKVATHEYSASAAAATLELDSYSLSTARAIADLQRSATFARRR